MRIGLRRAVTSCASLVTCVFVVACAASGSAGGGGARASDAMPEWFHLPCLEDSVDDFGWALHEVMGISLRVPTEFRRELVPAVDELHFRRGQSTLDLYVRRDASRIFAGYAEAAARQRYCEGPIGGWIAEAVSFRDGFQYGFAARWADASQGEYLAAVIRGATVRDATLLRQALFTLRFPGQKR